MADGTEISRWQTAQSSEQGYWSGMNVPGLLRICADMPTFLDKIPEPRRDNLFAGKEVLEIGCGPLGISLASFYRGPASIQRLVKCEPLEQMDISTVPPESPTDAAFLDYARRVSEHGDYLRSAGEDLNFAGSFDTVITMNVLDHVQDPAMILSNAFSALRKGGNILVGVDCRSVLGKLKFNQYTRRVAADTTLVQAHPFTFLISDIVHLLERAGFSDVEVYGKPSPLGMLAGGCIRPAFIGRKAL